MRCNKRNIRIIALILFCLVIGVLPSNSPVQKASALAFNGENVVPPTRQSQPVFQQTAKEPADWQGRLIQASSTGRNVFVQGIFRIVYYTQGEHAVPDIDLNHNGIPDFVEDTALQLRVAYHIYHDLAGFPRPWDLERYKDVNCIVVNIFSRERTGANGLSFQVPQRPLPPAPPGALALIIRIAKDLPVQRNATPAHEYFHHIQNGASYFLSAWYQEGMAVWSQDALTKTPPPNASWEELEKYLYDMQGIENLYAGSYNTAQFLWNPLAWLCHTEDSRENLPEEDPILQSRYVDGTPVLKDFSFPGAPVMRAVLREFAVQEKAAFKDNGYQDWSYENRRDRRNYPYQLQAIRNVVTDFCRRTHLLGSPPPGQTTCP